MSTKAVATDTLFLIATMALFLVFTIISLYYWIIQTPVEASRATCTAKYLNYCERWVLEKKNPDDWGELEPKECEKFDIKEPTDVEDCKNIT